MSLVSDITRRKWVLPAGLTLGRASPDNAHLPCSSQTEADHAMAGHSAFKNIMHKKGKADAARAKMFAKFSREITVAAKLGSPDPAMNPRLRLAVKAAKGASRLAPIMAPIPSNAKKAI